MDGTGMAALLFWYLPFESQVLFNRWWLAATKTGCEWQGKS